MLRKFIAVLFTIVYLFVGYGMIEECYLKNIVRYPKKYCIKFRGWVRMLFPFARRDTTKGVPREIVGAVIIHLVLGAITLIHISLASGAREELDRIVSMYLVLSFVVLGSINIIMSKKSFIAEYKKLTLKNHFKVAVWGDYKKKKNLGEVELLEVRHHKKGLYGTVKRRKTQEIIKDVLIQEGGKEDFPYHLYEHYGVYWIEKAEKRNYIIIEELAKAMVSKDREMEYFIDKEMYSVESFYKEFDTFTKNSSSYIKIPRIADKIRRRKRRKGWRDWLFLEEDEIVREVYLYSEKWCEKMGLDYRYQGEPPSVSIYRE